MKGLGGKQAVELVVITGKRLPGIDKSKRAVG